MPEFKWVCDISCIMYTVHYNTLVLKNGIIYCLNIRINRWTNCLILTFDMSWLPTVYLSLTLIDWSNQFEKKETMLVTNITLDRNVIMWHYKMFENRVTVNLSLCCFCHQLVMQYVCIVEVLQNVTWCKDIDRCNMYLLNTRIKGQAKGNSIHSNVTFKLTLRG